MSVLFMMVSVGIYCRNISGEFDRHGCIMRVDSDGVACISMALFSQVCSFFYYETLAWVEGCIMNDEGKVWWLFWLGRERLM